MEAHDATTVRFELPDYVKITDECFDGAKVTVEYDSNYNGCGETVTVSGTAELDEGRWSGEWDTLNVDGCKVRSNGHVFSETDDRHLGTVESVTVTVNKETAIDLVTENVDHDVDCGEDEVIVQTWDKAVIEEQGFMAGTDEIRMECI